MDLLKAQLDRIQQQLAGLTPSGPAAVYLYSSLPNEAVRSALLTPCHDVGAQVRSLLAARGPQARLLVLPEGPQTILGLMHSRRRIQAQLPRSK